MKKNPVFQIMLKDVTLTRKDQKSFEKFIDSANSLANSLGITAEFTPQGVMMTGFRINLKSHRLSEVNKKIYRKQIEISCKTMGKKKLLESNEFKK